MLIFILCVLILRDLLIFRRREKIIPEKLFIFRDRQSEILNQKKRRNFCKGMADLVGYRGGVLIGVDLKKDVAVLEAAYNDKKGVTASFNMNLLVRMNQELGANFTLEHFKHKALFNEQESCIEMHLESLEDQSVSLGDQEIIFQKGETIRTEQSHKYSLDAFKDVAKKARNEHSKSLER